MTKPTEPKTVDEAVFARMMEIDQPGYKYPTPRFNPYAPFPVKLKANNAPMDS